jgi:hypothetical protein
LSKEKTEIAEENLKQMKDTKNANVLGQINRKGGK